LLHALWSLRYSGEPERRLRRAIRLRAGDCPRVEDSANAGAGTTRTAHHIFEALGCAAQFSRTLRFSASTTHRAADASLTRGSIYRHSRKWTAQRPAGEPRTCRCHSAAARACPNTIAFLGDAVENTRRDRRHQPRLISCLVVESRVGGLGQQSIQQACASLPLGNRAELHHRSPSFLGEVRYKLDI